MITTDSFFPSASMSPAEKISTPRRKEEAGQVYTLHNFSQVPVPTTYDALQGGSFTFSLICWSGVSIGSIANVSSATRPSFCSSAMHAARHLRPEQHDSSTRLYRAGTCGRA